MTAFDRVVDALMRVTGATIRNGSTRCPAHDDRNPSLSVTGKNGRVLLHCFTGCSEGAILDAIGLSKKDLFDNTGETSVVAGAEVVYPYYDERGELLYQVVRKPKADGGRSFFQRKPKAGGGWDYRVAGVRRVLYRLPEVLEAVANGDPVYVCEGEKDAEAVAAAGECGTTMAGGARKQGAVNWLDSYSGSLAGATVAVVGDDDEAGRAHAAGVAEKLRAAGCDVTVWLPAEGHKDAAEHLGAGKTLDELRAFGAADGLVTVGAADGWGTPIPLGFTDAPPLFPTSVFPGWLREMVDALTVALQTPPDLAGCLALAVLSTAAGGRAVVEVREGWREPVNLYLAVAMAPAERKSPAFSRMVAPLMAAEGQMVEEARPGVLSAEAERQALMGDVEVLQAQLARSDGEERERVLGELVDVQMSAEAVTVPTIPRLLADDVTPEALATLMFEQLERLAVLSDEGELFELMGGRYGGKVNLGIFLKAHPGTPYRLDRKSRGPEFMMRPALTLGLAVQPEVLRSVARSPGFRGKGLLARFLWALPESRVGGRLVGVPPVPVGVGDCYDAEVKALVLSLAEWVDPAVLPLTSDAHELLLGFERRLEPQLERSSGLLGSIGDWGGKLVGHVARLAGLLHLAGSVRSGWGQPVGVESMEGALCLADFFVEHALRVFDFMGADEVMESARLVWDWAVRQDGGVFSRRDCHRRFQGRFGRVDELDPVLELLVERGWVRLRDDGGGKRRGRPASPVFLVHPGFVR